MSKDNRIFDLEERLIDFAVRIIRNKGACCINPKIVNYYTIYSIYW